MPTVLDRLRLDGEAAVVTGAGRGIGRGIAIGLAEAGADVVLTARRLNELEETAEAVRATGRRAAIIPGDLTDIDFIESLADRAVWELGKVTIWVNNAGGADDRVQRRLDEMPERQWDYQLDLNLKAVWACAKAASRVMTGPGSIINISSGAARNPSPMNGPYAAAKAGVDSLTRTLARELAPRKIRVNGVSPGPIPTEVFLEFFKVGPEAIPELAKRMGLPLGRLGTPEDIAAACVYLASSAADWVTGETIQVNGGPR
jgi:7-alpha-hydroxysteroid dehydrogenase